MYFICKARMGGIEAKCKNFYAFGRKVEYFFNVKLYRKEKRAANRPVLIRSFKQVYV